MRDFFLLSAAALTLTACGPQAATAEAETKGSEAVVVETKASESEAAPTVDGKPMWSANRSQTAEENAQESFDRNGEAFGAKDLDDFVRLAHDFTDSPPKGAETLKRANGDTLIYDARSNTFAVVTKDGAPRTLFKPDEGAAYWAEQKEREARRAASAKG